jgi:hypothetical protein
MAVPPYQISRKSTKRIEVISVGQTGDLISLLSFLESMLKTFFLINLVQFNHFPPLAGL